VDAAYHVAAEVEDEVGYSSLQYVGINSVVRYALPIRW
jgi:hypothetical protein